MSQNLVIPNKDNKVVFVFAGIALTSATNIVIGFGAETYSKTADPLKVVVTSATELTLDLSSTSEVGKIFATITYFDGGSVYGTDITSMSLGNSEKIVIAVGTQLIIEDGTGKVDSNSFASDARLLAHANLRNITLPATQPVRESLLILAMDYIVDKETLMKGERNTQAQRLPYPRSDVYMNGYYITNVEIPEYLIMAQIELAIQASKSDILLSETTNNLASFNVDGVYSESYFSGGSYTSIRTDKADAYLKPLLINNGAFNIMQRV